MNRLEDNVQKLREIEEEQLGCLEEIRTLEVLIAENKKKIERAEFLADSYRAIIAHESGKDESFLAKEAEGRSYGELAGLSQRNQKRKTASSFLKPEYVGVRQNEIIKRILREALGKKLRTDELVEKAYDVSSYEELKKVKGTMASALSRGVTKGLWQGGSGAYYLEELNSEN